LLYLALEDNDRRVARRLYRLGIPATRDLYIETANKLTPQNINEILDAVPFVKMLIFDTQGRYFENETTDGNDYNEMTRMVATLHTIANKREMAIITCTHTRKNVDKEDWVNSVIGSKALVAVSDTILMLTRERESTEGKLHITGRDVDEFTIEMEHTEDWLWYDKKTDFTATEPLSEFEQFR
jgi:RecA-family ATPase